jgi:hypothetical protein
MKAFSSSKMVCFESKAKIGISGHSQCRQAGYIQDGLPALDEWHGGAKASPAAARRVCGSPGIWEDVPDVKTTAVMDLLTSRNTSYIDITTPQAFVVLPGRVKDIQLKRVLLPIRWINHIEVRYVTELQCKEDVLCVWID